MPPDSDRLDFDRVIRMPGAIFMDFLNRVAIGTASRDRRWPETVTPRRHHHRVDNEPTPEDLEQLARSLAMSGSLGEHNRQVAAEALRRLAEIERAMRRHPSGRASRLDPKSA